MGSVDVPHGGQGVGRKMLLEVINFSDDVAIEHQIDRCCALVDDWDVHCCAVVFERERRRVKGPQEEP